MQRELQCRFRMHCSVAVGSPPCVQLGLVILGERPSDGIRRHSNSTRVTDFMTLETLEETTEGGLPIRDLFDMDSVAMDSPRMAAIKAADIQTHHAPHMEEYPWLAIPMHAARERLKGYITKDEPFNMVADITASFGRVLDDYGMLFYGETEKEAQDAARASLSNV
jgi:hypothetical protein